MKHRIWTTFAPACVLIFLITFIIGTANPTQAAAPSFSYDDTCEGVSFTNTGDVNLVFTLNGLPFLRGAGQSTEYVGYNEEDTVTYVVEFGDEVVGSGEVNKPAECDQSTETTPWTGNGSDNLPCQGGETLWNLEGFGETAGDVSDVVLTVNGSTYPMSPQGNGFRVVIPGPATDAEHTTASATWTWSGEGEAPTAVLTISHCEGGTTTTSTTTTTTTAPPTTTTPPTTAPPTTTGTTPPTNPPTTTGTTPPTKPTNPPTTQPVPTTTPNTAIPKTGVSMTNQNTGWVIAFLVLGIVAAIAARFRRGNAS